MNDLRDNIDYHFNVEGNNTTLIVHEGVTCIPVSAFNDSRIDSVVLPSTLKSIGAYAFHGNRIKEIDIPDSVEHIGSYSFSECKNLSRVKFPHNLRIIRPYSFTQTRLNKIELPDTVEVIGPGAFYQSSYNMVKKELVLPKSLKILSKAAFLSNYLIHIVKYNDGLLYVARNSFDIQILDNKFFALPSSIEYFKGDYYSNDKAVKKENTSLYTLVDGVLTIKEGVEWVGDFGGLDIKEVIFPSTTKYISDEAFSFCNTLKKITFNDGLIYIGSNAFRSAELDMKEVILPESLLFLGNDSFGAFNGKVMIPESACYNEYRDSNVATYHNSPRISNIIDYDKRLLSMGINLKGIKNNVSKIRKADETKGNYLDDTIYYLFNNNAIDENDIGLFEEFIKSGAKIRERSFKYFVSNGKNEFIKCLINYGYDIKDILDNYFLYSVIYENIELMEIFYLLGANINIINKEGNSPLMYAVSSNNYEVVKFLIDNGANTRVTNSEGKTALDIAKSINNPDILLLLQERTNGIDTSGDIKKLEMLLGGKK